MSIKTKNLQFELSGQSKSGLTSTWNVINRYNNTQLGTVGWYGPWRQYSFFPNPVLDLVFEKQCLRDIADFCESKTKEHDKRRREPF